MFGKIVLDIPGDKFEEVLDHAKEAAGVKTDPELNPDQLATLIESFKQIIRDATGSDFPQDPREQLRQAIVAVFSSWNGDRAIAYRRQNKISDDLGTAVNVQAMVFGNMGEDVVAGIRNTLRIAELGSINKAA